MHRSPLVAVAALLLFASVVAFGAEIVEVTNCQDSICQTGCQDQYFAQHQCLKENGSNNTVELSCYKGPAVCVTSTFYSDKNCVFPSATVTDVCGSCQDGYQISCGGVKDGVFWVYNCSDNACQDCSGAKLLQFDQCTQLMNGGNVMVHKTYACDAVKLHTYPSSANCGDTPFTIQYPDGYCNNGVILHCTNTSAKSHEKNVAGGAPRFGRTPGNKAMSFGRLAGLKKL